MAVMLPCTAGFSAPRKRSFFTSASTQLAQALLGSGSRRGDLPEILDPSTNWAPSAPLLKGDQPKALIVHLDDSITEREEAVWPALAASLFKNGAFSLGAVRRLSGMPLPDFLDHLSKLGIDVVAPDETTDREVDDPDRWLAS